MKKEETPKAEKLSLRKTTVKNLTAVRTGIQTGFSQPGCPSEVATYGCKGCASTRI